MKWDEDKAPTIRSATIYFGGFMATINGPYDKKEHGFVYMVSIYGTHPSLKAENMDDAKAEAPAVIKTALEKALRELNEPV